MKNSQDNVTHDIPGQAGRRQAARRRGQLYMRMACVLLMVNMALLLVMQLQINSMGKTLAQFSSRVTIGKEESGVLDQNYYSGADGTIISQEKSADVEEWVKPAIDDDPVSLEVDYVTLCGLPEVDKPKRRSEFEVLERLQELSEENDIIVRICQESYAYPAKMLEALANNPEMARFVEGYLDPDKQVGGGLTEAEKEQEYPLFLQWDPRWGYHQYGEESVIGLAGCGPTCLSMVLYYLLEDETLTPDVIADYSMENGYYMPGTGTTWALLQDVPEMYGLEVHQYRASEKTMKKALDQGQIIICSVKAGEFTAVGHFIVIYGYDEEGFLINDPNCVARSRQKWPYSKFGKQIKNMWTYTG